MFVVTATACLRLNQERRRQLNFIRATNLKAVILPRSLGFYQTEGDDTHVTNVYLYLTAA